MTALHICMSDHNDQTTTTSRQAEEEAQRSDALPDVFDAWWRAADDRRRLAVATRMIEVSNGRRSGRHQGQPELRAEDNQAEAGG